MTDKICVTRRSFPLIPKRHRFFFFFWTSDCHVGWWCRDRLAHSYHSASRVQFSAFLSFHGGWWGVEWGVMALRSTCYGLMCTLWPHLVKKVKFSNSNFTYREWLFGKSSCMHSPVLCYLQLSSINLFANINPPHNSLPWLIPPIIITISFPCTAHSPPQPSWLSLLLCQQLHRLPWNTNKFSQENSFRGLPSSKGVMSRRKYCGRRDKIQTEL